MEIRKYPRQAPTCPICGRRADTAFEDWDRYTVGCENCTDFRNPAPDDYPECWPYEDQDEPICPICGAEGFDWLVRNWQGRVIGCDRCTYQRSAWGAPDFDPSLWE